MQERITIYERALPSILIGGGLLSYYLGRIYSRMNRSRRPLRDAITITSYSVYVHTFCVPILLSTTSSVSVVVCLKLVNVSGTSRRTVCSMHSLRRMAWYVTLNCLINTAVKRVML